MTDEYNDAPAWMVDYAQDCRALLGIGDDWHIWLKVVDNPDADADADASVEDDGVCRLSTRYLRAEIRIRRGLDEGRTRSVILHELLHIALAPLSQAAARVIDLVPDRMHLHVLALFADAEEQTIERLTRALLRTVRPLSQAIDESPPAIAVSDDEIDRRLANLAQVFTQQ